jgi:hypothetical protein
MGLKSTLFGKPPEPQKTESGNHAYDSINSAFSPGFNYFTQGGNMLGNLLGVNGGGAQTSALENYSNSGGMKFLMDQGQRAITSSKAASGLLNSGSYGTALEKYGQGLASTYLNQYMDNLNKYSNLGLGAGQLVTGAGQYSQGTGATQGKSGILPMLLQAGAAIGTGGASLGLSGAGAAAGGVGPAISDRRVKRNIVEVGALPNGLKIYEYEVFGKRQKGVMANEVALIQPEAYLPNHYGPYHGVDYSKIEDWETVNG